MNGYLLHKRRKRQFLDRTFALCKSHSSAKVLSRLFFSQQTSFHQHIAYSHINVFCFLSSLIFLSSAMSSQISFFEAVLDSSLPLTPFLVPFPWTYVSTSLQNQTAFRLLLALPNYSAPALTIAALSGERSTAKDCLAPLRRTLS